MSALTKGISHLGLTVPDLEESVKFFTEGLGWDVLGGDPEYPATYIGDGTSVLTLWQAWADEPVAANRETNIGLHHLALAVADLETFEKVFAKIAEYPGVEVEFPPQQNPVGVGPRVHFMVYEPGGNRIEILVDPEG